MGYRFECIVNPLVKLMVEVAFVLLDGIPNFLYFWDAQHFFDLTFCLVCPLSLSFS